MTARIYDGNKVDIKAVNEPFENYATAFLAVMLAASPPVTRPHTKHSAVEFEPSRFAPCNDTHETSPAAQIFSAGV